MQKLIDWCKKNLLFTITLFLLAFIPLYPKLPLIDIAHTWAYIRLEDFLVAIACVILIVTKIRERKRIETPLNVPIITYFVVAGVSLLNALLFIFPFFPTELLPHLAFLHYARRIEYISVFFLAFEAFRRKPKLWGIISVLTVTYVFVLLYGIGQKFLGFPAFLTMNEEFAKGVPLRLPSTARIPSTFGGHYDLAAYLVLTIPIMGSLIFGVKKWFLKLFFFVFAVFGLVVLLFTASRISFAVYLVAICTMLFWQKKAILIIPVIVLSVFILNITSGASERFYKTFRISDVVIDLSTGKPIGTLDKLEGMSARLEVSESPAQESLPKGSEFINIPSSGSLSQKTIEQEAQSIQKVEYFTSDGLKKGTGEMATISGSFLVQKALVYDISITTRLQGQWPKAIAAFKRNMLLGSGLSSLSLAADGDYHRMLGETGILGAIAFLGILLVSFVVFFRSKDSLDVTTRSFVIGVYAGLTGLLCNAVLIDVFEASKVAFTLWLILGFCMGMMTMKKDIRIPYFHLLKRIFIHPKAFIAYLWILTFLIWGKALSLYFMGDDFTWTRWAAQSSMFDIAGYFTHASGFFYRPLPKLWYFVLFSIFWLRPFAYHVASLVLVSGIVTLLYLYLIKRGISKIFAWGSAFLFVTLSIHHENIFWISGQSSLLSALFLLMSMYAFENVWKRRIQSSIAYIIGIYICTFFSMASYDGMIVAPVLLVILSIGNRNTFIKTLPILVLIPLYWIIRTFSGAVPPSGDYGYKAATFLVNSAGNGMTYLLGILFGPQVLEYSGMMRAFLKERLLYVSIATSGVFVLSIGIFYRAKHVFASYKKEILYFMLFVISSASYLGLGNVSERYAFIPSLFLCMSLGQFFFTLWKRYDTRIVKGGIILTVSALVWWNVSEIHRVEKNWIKASDVVESTLLSIKQDVYPPRDVLSFFIINTPIRYGRAWIFPTGMTDALWHMFRENLYAVYPMPTIQSAYEYRTYKGERLVYVFEDYVIKKGYEKVTEIKQ